MPSMLQDVGGHPGMALLSYLPRAARRSKLLFVAGAAEDVEQAQDAKASASANPAVFVKEQTVNRHIDSRIPCSKRLKIS